MPRISLDQASRLSPNVEQEVLTNVNTPPTQPTTTSAPPVGQIQVEEIAFPEQNFATKEPSTSVNFLPGGGFLSDGGFGGGGFGGGFGEDEVIESDSQGTKKATSRNKKIIYGLLILAGIIAAFYIYKRLNK